MNIFVLFLIEGAWFKYLSSSQSFPSYQVAVRTNYSSEIISRLNFKKKKIKVEIEPKILLHTTVVINLIVSVKKYSTNIQANTNFISIKYLESYDDIKSCLKKAEYTSFLKVCSDAEVSRTKTKCQYDITLELHLSIYSENGYDVCLCIIYIYIYIYIYSMLAISRCKF